MVPQHQRIFLGGIAGHRPFDEIDQGFRISHVDLSQAFHSIARNWGHVFLNVEAFASCPVSVRGVISINAVELDHDVDVGIGAHCCHLEEVIYACALQVVVGIEIDHECPGWQWVRRSG